MAQQLTLRERQFIATALVLLARKLYQKKSMTAQEKRFAAKLYRLSYKLEMTSSQVISRRGE